MTKRILAVLLCCVVGKLFAAEKNLVKNGGFEDGSENWKLSTKAAIVENGAAEGAKALSMKGRSFAVTKELIAIDMKDTYTLSAQIKTKSPKDRMFLAFKCYDKDKKLIRSWYVDYFPNTETELTEECKAGDNTFKIKDGGAWKKHNYAVIAFNVDASGKFSDLPNSDCHYGRVVSVENKGDYWLVTSKDPIKKAYPAGTKIREHLGGKGVWSFSVISCANTDGQWVTVNTSLNGCHTQPGHRSEPGKWRAGTAFVKVYIAARATKDGEVTIDDIKFCKSNN